MKLLVKHGPQELALEPEEASTVGQLKQQLERLTGVFVRQQKLIHKGRVLEDAAQLADSKLADGAKLMLLASQGLPIKGQPSGSMPQKRPQQFPASARAGGGSSGTNSSSSSSLLAEKMASMAAARGSTAAGAAAAAAACAMPDRRAAWGKTGVIALRDMQLDAVQASWLEGIAGARAADLSHNRLTCLPASLCQLSSLGSLKLAHNRLADDGVPWPQLCAGLAGLTSLLLGCNQLSRLPACVGQLTGLVQLGLEANNLTEVEPGALRGLARLEVLQLQDNQLAVLPDCIGSCASLVALNASRNSLAGLPDALCSLTRLQVLAVDSNRLAALPPRLFVGCSSLATLSAHANPITVEALRSAEGFAGYDARRQARASKQLGGRVMADLDKAFSEGADVEQWQRWAAGPAGLGSDGSGRAGK